MNVLDKYIIREVLKGSFGALVVLLVLFNFFTLTSELNDMGKGDYGLTQVFQYLALTSPRVTYELVPFGALLGSLLVLGAMANNREVVAMRAAGFSLFRIIGAVLQAGLILVVFSVVVGEFVAPICERSAQMIKMTAQNQQVALSTRYGFWLRDGNTFINIRQILDSKKLNDLSIYELDKEQRLRTVIHAEKARFKNKGWMLEDIRSTSFREEQVVAEKSTKALWKSAIEPKLLNVVVVKSDNLSLYDLANYVEFLKDNNQKAQVFEVAFWRRLVNPLITFVMLIVSVPFVLGVHRSVSLGNRVMIGVIVGMGFNIMDNIFGHLSLVYDLNPLFAALFPATIVLIAAGTAISKLR